MLPACCSSAGSWCRAPPRTASRPAPFAVREHVVPLLSEALADEPATFETLIEAVDGVARLHPSLLADG